MNRSKFLIPTKDLDQEVVYEFHDLAPEELDVKCGRSITVSNINATVSLQKSAIGIGVDFHVVFHGEYICMRCLVAFADNYDSSLHLDYVEGDDPYVHIDNVELTPHDADRVYYRGPLIDLSLGIREALLLALPITPVCKDDCRGLCPECGANWNLKRCKCKVEKAGIFTPQSKTVKK